MKERPILFSAAMVRAILDGCKTQTRRVVKLSGGREIDYAALEKLANASDPLLLAMCPYGVRGDRLWVRESFWGCDSPETGDTPCVVYDNEWHGKVYRPAEIRPWAPRFGRIPSIHMPRDCSRITLEVTGVRVERLQSISERDTEAEGVLCETADPLFFHVHTDRKVYDFAADYPRDSYRMLWDSLNDERGHGWKMNPWVWVVEFKRA